MKLKYEFVTTELDDQIFAIPVGANAAGFRGILKLNASATAILKLMKKETTVIGIVSALMEEYEGIEEEWIPIVEKFVKKMADEKLLII